MGSMQISEMYIRRLCQGSFMLI